MSSPKIPEWISYLPGATENLNTLANNAAAATKKRYIEELIDDGRHRISQLLTNIKKTNSLMGQDIDLNENFGRIAAYVNQKLGLMVLDQGAKDTEELSKLSNGDFVVHYGVPTIKTEAKLVSVHPFSLNDGGFMEAGKVTIGDILSKFYGTGGRLPTITELSKYIEDKPNSAYIASYDDSSATYVDFSKNTSKSPSGIAVYAPLSKIWMPIDKDFTHMSSLDRFMRDDNPEKRPNVFHGSVHIVWDIKQN